MIRRWLKYGLLLVTLMVILMLAALRWEAGSPRDEWFQERQGGIVAVDRSVVQTPDSQLAEAVHLRSSSGLEVDFRVIRPLDSMGQLPVLLTLGGHRTGSDAVDLFGAVGQKAVVGIDYPYDGPERVKGFGPVVKTIPLARQAFLDTVPAVSLVLDWLLDQSWADPEKIIIIGASLGAPFAAATARRDQRIRSIVLVHAAADNRLWLEVQLARRSDSGLLTYPLSYLLHWLAYGPIFDTRDHVAHLAPRPLLIINARNDERTPQEQGRLLVEAASEPKKLRYTNGRHVQPGRREIIEELLKIADEEMPFLVGEH